MDYDSLSLRTPVTSRRLYRFRDCVCLPLIYQRQSMLMINITPLSVA
jgi:hypothetical protein